MVSYVDFPKVSFVIPVYNEEKNIGHCLCSVLNQDYMGEWEVLIVDGISNDKTLEIVHEIARENPNKIRIFENPDRVIPKALNMGIKNAKYDIIVRLDGHAYIGRDYLTKVVQKLETTDAACIGPRMIMVPGSSKTSQAIAQALMTPFGPGTSTFRYSDKEDYTDTANYAIYRRIVFKDVGYFDEKLLSNEDYEFHYRLRLSGYKILYFPEVKAYYYPRQNYSDLWKQYFRYGYWKSQMLIKFPRSIKLRHLVAPSFMGGLFWGGLLACFSKVIRFFWLISVLLYMFLSLFFAIRQSLRINDRELIIKIIFSFIIMHFAWGIGFWFGLVKSI